MGLDVQGAPFDTFGMDMTSWENRMPGRYPKVKASNHAYYLRNKEAVAASRYAWHKARFARIVAAYGGTCACGATDVRLEKLPGVPESAKSLKGGVLHKWIVDNGFPPVFRLRCPVCIHAQRMTASEKCRRYRLERQSPELAERGRKANKLACASYRKNHPDTRLETKRNRRAAKLSTGVITKEEWARVLEAAKHRCLACGSDRRLTMDHIIPLVKGGTHTINNVQPLCHSCNCKKNVKAHDYRPPEMLRALGITPPLEEGDV